MFPVVQNAFSSAPMATLPIIGHTFPSASTFTVVKMEFSDAGTYNDQYMRVFETMIDRDVIQKFQILVDNHANSQRITSAAAGTVAPSFMQISATPFSNIRIPQGWGERRLRFRLIVEETSNLASRGRIRHIFQGFTESHGVSMSGHIDPNMNLYINSFMMISREQIIGPNGSVMYHDRIIESGQVMDPHLLKSSLGNSVQMMRPSDLMAHNSNAYTANYSRSTIGEIGSIIDGRTMIASNSLFNNRNNNVNVDYVTQSLNALKYARAFESFGENNDTAYDKAFGKLYQGSNTDNSFLTALGAQLGITGTSNRFTLNNLKSIDYNFKAPEYNQMVGMALSSMHRTGQTETWNGTNLLTQAASTLANGVPALATDLLIHSMEFSATNSSIGGQQDVRFVSLNSASGGYVDLTQCGSLFAERFKSEIMPPISHNNLLTYAVKIRYNIFDEIRISISLDGCPMTDYVMPVFADAIITPVVAPNINHVNKVTDDLERLVNHIDFNATAGGIESISTSMPMTL